MFLTDFMTDASTTHTHATHTCLMHPLTHVYGVAKSKDDCRRDPHDDDREILTHMLALPTPDECDT